MLVAPRNPLNIGAAARAMSNFGVFQLRVVRPYQKAFREAVSAVGASGILAKAEEFEDLSTAIADCSLVVGTTAVGNRELQHSLYLPHQAAPKIRGRLQNGRVALLFGSEKWGLSNDDLSHCHWLLHIPARKEHQSMNLGQAVAVCLYELARQPALRSTAAGAAATAPVQTVERITAALFEALQISGYIKPRAGASAEQKLRRVIRRFALQPADAEVLLGMLHKLLWKLRSMKG